MRRHVEVALVDDGLVSVGFGDGRPQVVWNKDQRTTGQEVERVHVRFDPMRQLLRGQRLRVRVVARAQDRDEDLGAHDLGLGDAVVDGHGLTGEVDEELLAGEVIVPHHQVDATLVLAVVLGEPRVLEPVGVLLLVLLPQHLQRRVFAPQLPVNAHPLGHRSCLADRGVDPREQHVFEGAVVHLDRQRPGDAFLHGAVQMPPDRDAWQTQ